MCVARQQWPVAGQRWHFLWSQFFWVRCQAPAQQWSNNGVVFSLGSVLRARCHGNIFLLIITKYKLPGALSPGVKPSGREAEIQPERQKGEVVRSRNTYMKQLKTEFKWKINVKWSTIHSYHLCPWRHNGLVSRGRISRRGKMFLFSTTSGPVLGPTQPPFQWVPGALPQVVKTFANYNYFYIMP
jgi:hypothetical protein